MNSGHAKQQFQAELLFKYNLYQFINYYMQEKGQEPGVHSEIKVKLGMEIWNKLYIENSHF